MNTTLPTDSAERKEYPMFRGLLRYFPAALAGVSRISKIGNDKHNPGEEMHHARGKSTDHADCILRHLTDLDGLLASPGTNDTSERCIERIREEASCLAWRALALSQELHERFGAPLAPGAKLPLVKYERKTAIGCEMEYPQELATPSPLILQAVASNVDSTQCAGDHCDGRCGAEAGEICMWVRPQRFNSTSNI